MSSFDTLVDAGLTLDWITPADGLVRDVLSGPHYIFVVPEADTGIAYRVLKDGRYHAWGVFTAPIEQVFTFTVALDVAGKLYDELLAAGVRVLNINPPKRARAKVRAARAGVQGDNALAWGW